MDYLSYNCYNRVIELSEYEKRGWIKMDDKILLIDENGDEREFELIVSIDIEDKTYVLLSEDEDSEDVYPFVIGQDEEGEVLMPVEDEDEFLLIEEAYSQLMEDDE